MPAADRPVTLPEAFQRTSRIGPDAVALRTVGDTQTLTWRDYAARVRQVAAGLAALGVGRGDTVSLMMANRIEFYPLEVGAQHVGATSLSVYNALAAKQLTRVLAYAGTKVVICEEQYVDRIKASGAGIDAIVCIDGSPEDTISVDDLIARGSADFDFESSWRAVQPDDVATLIYTSGTTGNPKQVEITHTSLLSEVFGLDEVLGLRYGDRVTSFLPTAHIADRLNALYIQEAIGTQVTVVAHITTIAAALPDVRPTIWGAMPLVWEKLKAGIEATVAAQTGVKRALADWGLGAANTRARALLRGSELGVADRVQYAVSDILVLSKIRAAIGLDQARWLICGDAPIPRETLAFFAGLGLPMTEAWGMSELSGIATVSHPRDAVLGCVGKPLPGLEARVAADGEFLVRGPLLMKGYRNEPEKTAEAIDSDGWLHTGDIATVDDDGTVSIIDRKKELIVNAAGKTMSPCHIENTIKAACGLIGAMMTVGDARPYNTALLVLNAEAARAYATRKGLPDASPETLATDVDVIAQIATGVGRGNAKLSPVEQIKRFKVLPVFWEPGGDEITLTMKLKRKPVTQKYAADIAELYAAQPGSAVHEPKPPSLEGAGEQRRCRPLLLWAWSLLRLDVVGVAFGALFFCLSLTPSLLPRDWLFQGLIGGVNAGIGYGIGVVIGKIFHRMVLRWRSWWPPSSRVLYRAKVVSVGVSAAAGALMVIPAAGWQRQVSALMGTEGPSTLGYMRTLIIAAAVGGALVGVSRVLIDAVRVFARYFIRRWQVNDEVAQFIGTAIVVVLVITLVHGVLFRGFIVGASAVYEPHNASTRPGITQPIRPERSGSPESFARWDTLGYQGRNFVATGPHAQELTELNGRPAKEPIRIYAGLQTADSTEGRVAVVLSELQRTHAFDRKVLVIIPTTGTGWVDPVAARSIESMYNGDTALVAMQYSYLPSMISFLADKQSALDAGKALIDGVQRRWAQQPPDHRPNLALYGESLGSMAGQGAFGYLPDIAEMGFSSVLWVGPPNASTLWQVLTVRRDRGTPEVEPRYDNGRTVRFSQGDDIAAVAAPPWQGTRVLFLQCASDAVVWWSPDLLFKRPDWLVQPPGRGRTASMRWYPIVTFWQVGFDVTDASAMPAGHGHNYGDAQLDGWVAVAPPEGWTPEDTERIRRALEKVEAVGGPEF